MEACHKEALRMNAEVLCNEMNADMVVAGLVLYKIYEPYNVSEYMSQKGSFKQNKAILTSLEARGPKAFGALIKSLIDAKQDHLVLLLQGSVPKDAEEEPKDAEEDPFSDEAFIEEDDKNS